MTRDRRMRVSRWIAALLALAAGTFVAACDRERAAAGPIDLVARLEGAERRPAGAPVAVDSVAVAGDSRQAIGTGPVSRLIWRLRVPADTVLDTAIAVDPRDWTTDGGVLFRIGVSDGRTYEELLNRTLEPFARAADRRWVPVTLDFGRYGGRKWSLFYHPRGITWEVIFNASPVSPGPATLRPLWGEPRIAPRRTG